MDYRNYVFLLIISAILISGCIVNSQNYQMKESEELKIKSYLVKKYNPGTCFGMPKIVPDEIIEKTLRQNSDLVKYIKNKFGPLNDREIFRKIVQLKNIELKRNNNIYYFTFSDGRCCEITEYEGEAEMNEGRVNDKIINKFTKSVPC